MKPSKSRKGKGKEKGGGLEVLKLSGAYKLGDAECASLIDSSCKTLRSLQLDACPRIGASLVASASRLTSLSSLTLTNCEKINNNHLISLRPIFEKLRVLDLSNFASLDDNTLQIILAANDGYLVELNLEATGISDRSLVIIRCLNKHNNLKVRNKTKQNKM